MFFRKYLFCLFISICPISTFANLNEQVRKTLISDLDLIRNIFSVQYAPKAWKKEFNDWNLEKEIANAKKEVSEMRPLTIKGYQRVIRKFLLSPADYHVGVEFFSTEQALLPFSIRGAEGRYFIVEIDRTLLPQHLFAAEIGDEILSFDGKPISVVINDLKKSDFYGNTPGTDQALAELALTHRNGAQGLIVPKGKVTLQVQSLRKNITRTISLNWIYLPELISEPGSGKNSYRASLTPAPIKKANKSFFDKQMVYAGCCTPNQLPTTDQSSYQIGAYKSYIPALGNQIWKNTQDDHFYSYIFLHGGKKIGYIRIPHYQGDEDEVEEFRKLIKRMEAQTDALVIDQVNNPGGSIFYLYALASLLTPSPLSTPKHCIALTQDEVMTAVALYVSLVDVENTNEAQEALGKTVGGYPVTMDFVKKTRQFAENIISEWEGGNFVTTPMFLFGVDDIEPYPKDRYSKPILFLINYLDFSGADFFPSIMKENKRATILGTRTAGAGGFVLESNFFNIGSIKKIKLTGSCAKTKNMMPLENIGVTPDVTVELTVNDLQNNCVDTKRTILEAIESLFKK